MKRFVLFLFVLLALCPPTPSRAQQGPSEPLEQWDASAQQQGNTSLSQMNVVALGRDAILGPEERARQVVVILGNAVIDGNVRKDVVVICGDVEVNGSVQGTVRAILGSVTLRPTARVGNGVVCIGGRYQADPQSVVHGQQNAIIGIFPSFAWLQDWCQLGLLMGRPFPHQLHWAWVIAGCFALLYFLMALLLPRPVENGADILRNKPVSAFFLGLLLLAFLVPLLILMIVSVVGIFLTPFVLLMACVAMTVGMVSIFVVLGRQLFGSFGSKLPLPVAFLLGLLLVYGLYLVPVVGFLVWGMATVLAFGAGVMTISAGLRRERPEPAHVYLVSPSQPAAPFTAGTPTPEAAPLPPPVLLPRVGFWRRLLATLLDLALIGFVSALFHFPPKGFLLLLTVYHIVLWSWKGATLGGIVLNHKLVRLDGRPMNFPVALLRSLSSYFSGIILGLGFFWAGWDREKQSWHDKIAGTVIVRMPKGTPLL